MKAKVVQITYAHETPDQTLAWIHHLIINLIIKELHLDPHHAGSWIKYSYRFLKLNNQLLMEDK